MDLTVVPYNHTTKSENGNDDVKHHLNNNNNNGAAAPAVAAATVLKPVMVEPVSDREPVVMNPISKSVTNNNSVTVKYKECMRNHAASLGAHANDGCGEFMPRGNKGDHELTCAACGCHRNFHRREVFGGDPPHHYPMHSHSHPPPAMLTLYNAGPTMPRGSHPHPHHPHQYQLHHHHQRVMNGGDHDHDHDRGRSETPERVGPSSGTMMMMMSRSGSNTSTKRFRTKFTQEQKEKMLEFAEKIGWRIQRHDDVALNQFCTEIGIKRNVLKVWMHNNKNAHRRRESGPEEDSPSQPQEPVGVEMSN
ncbi:zinc-finger homeodomain protein 2-like [Fagus crenata]